MQGLALAGGRFGGGAGKLEEVGPGGLERIEFGRRPRRRRTAAAGTGRIGRRELSRIALAIQVITARAGRVPTLDLRRGGCRHRRRGGRDGGAIAALAGTRAPGVVRDAPGAGGFPGRRALAVARAPQPARCSRALPLAGEARVEEVARMLGGAAITATTRKAAREMLAADS